MITTLTIILTIFTIYVMAEIRNCWNLIIIIDWKLKNPKVPVLIMSDGSFTSQDFANHHEIYMYIYKQMARVAHLSKHPSM